MSTITSSAEISEGAHNALSYLSSTLTVTLPIALNGSTPRMYFILTRFSLSRMPPYPTDNPLENL